MTLQRKCYHSPQKYPADFECFATECEVTGIVISTPGGHARGDISWEGFVHCNQNKEIGAEDLSIPWK